MSFDRNDSFGGLTKREKGGKESLRRAARETRRSVERLRGVWKRGARSDPRSSTDGVGERATLACRSEYDAVGPSDFVVVVRRSPAKLLPPFRAPRRRPVVLPSLRVHATRGRDTRREAEPRPNASRGACVLIEGPIEPPRRGIPTVVARRFSQNEQAYTKGLSSARCATLAAGT